jgi:hypothetical protein
MHVLQRHVSPDGLLTLVVIRDEDGDTSVGFEGYGWHTHADILASLSGLSEEAATNRFVQDVLAGQRVVGVYRVDGKVTDVVVTDDRESMLRYKPDNETIEFRLWDGRRC